MNERKHFWCNLVDRLLLAKPRSTRITRNCTKVACVKSIQTLHNLDWYTSELNQEGSQRFDNPLVRCAVARSYAVTVLHFKQVVSEWLAKKVRQPSACLSQNNLRSARVPLFRPRRQMNIKVALLLDDQTDLDSHRATTNLLFDAESLNNFVHARTAM